MGIFSWVFGNTRETPRLTAEEFREEMTTRAFKRVVHDQMSDLRVLCAEIRSAVQAHSTVLLRKRKALLTRDDYGKVVEDAWQREARYFLEKVIQWRESENGQRVLSQEQLKEELLDPVGDLGIRRSPAQVEDELIESLVWTIDKTLNEHEAAPPQLEDQLPSNQGIHHQRP